MHSWWAQFMMRAMTVLQGTGRSAGPDSRSSSGFAISWVDLFASLVIAVTGVVVAALETPGGLTWLGVVLPVSGGLALLQRRRFPVWVVSFVLIARVILAFADDCEFAMAPAALLALFSLSRHRPRSSRVLLAQVGAVVVAGTATAVGYYEVSLLGQVVGELALMLAALATGDALRTRTEQLDQRVEAEAQARVQAERLRIARDLHDVVAHGLSTISVQSGVAAHLLDSDTDNARRALEHINATGKRSLEELRAMVGVLRSTDEVQLRPAPAHPDDLTDLVEAAEAAGIHLTTSVEGSFPPDASDACVVALHRIAQEALTNVARHAGPVCVQLRIVHGEHAAECRVTNDPGTARNGETPSTGMGIIGMAERAHSVGGTVQTGPTGDGGFSVLVELPYRRPR